MYTDALKPVAELPMARDLMVSDLAFRIGCVGCESQFSGSAVLTTADKAARDQATQVLSDFSEATEVPVTVRLSSKTVGFGEQADPNCAECPLGEAGDLVGDTLDALTKLGNRLLK